jgi:hypothetical protein
MVLHHTDSGVICIGQAAHAWVSGQLARHWGGGRFARPEPFDDVCLGAEQHDVGMAGWDVRPELDPATGLPRSFMAMPLETHLELWSAAPWKVITQSPYAALLVSMHGRALYQGRPGDLARRYVAEQTVFQQDLMRTLGEPPERAARNQAIVWALDFLSLAPLVGWAPDQLGVPTSPGAPDVRLDIQPDGPLALTVDPWPFDTAELELEYPGRRLDGPVDRQEALDEALQTAPWTTVRARWRRP